MTLAEARDHWQLSDQELSRIWQQLAGKETGQWDGILFYEVDDVENAVLVVRKQHRPTWEKRHAWE
jgi:hypothetical protein